MWSRKRSSRRSFEQEQAARIAELTRSRRTIADAYEVERKRIERDLHDGAQQYIVAASMKLGEASMSASPPVKELIDAARHDLTAGLEALRETVRGISPHVLHHRGLVAALDDIAAHYGPHVVVRAPHLLPELSPSVLAAGYFFATEALANVAKHAPGAEVSVLVMADRDLRISVVDQGPGGARIIDGGGLAGMVQRLQAFGGGLVLNSPVGGPTQLAASIPLLVERGHSGLPATDQ
ncbi:sensor histidine kinase [Corynebacterium cystitidis]|uniref:sensor histidine kinase n=1 Tax=Corynebacterium cystitidis TaxID=35757 RepID=UPI00211EEE2A|nr:histidine kinase [Corynebacterium cystitidis]